MPIKSVITGLLTSVLLLTQTLALAAECSAKSGEKTVPLLELYTSEGCSSCPPADKWLSKLKHDPDEVSTLAFHVDYWNYIGWEDKFSKPEYSARQRRTAHTNKSRTVYTPQFVFSGRDFRGWNNRRLNTAIQKIQKTPSRADLSLDAVSQADGSIMLSANVSQVTNKHADVFVALYQNGLTTTVKAGENSGRELKHDYVVRKLFGAYAMNQHDALNKSFTLDATWKERDAGAVMFVQDRESGNIIQSLTLPFCS